MYISRLVVRNFRNFDLLDVPLQPGVTCIVGENNTGKTNLLHAIRLAVDAGLSSQYRVLTVDDFPAGTDFTEPQQVIISLELRDYASKPHEEATAGPWAIGDDLARLTYRFRPARTVREELEAGTRSASSLALDDYRWEIRGADGDSDPTEVKWNQDSGHSVRFEELQQFLVTLMHPLRDVEQSLRQSAGSPLGRLLSASDIPEAEQEALIGILADANEGIAASATIAQVGKGIEKTFAATAGDAFKMGVSLGMASPSFNDISRSLTVLLSNKAMTGFAPRLNGLGLNNVLFITMLLNFFENRASSGKTPGQLLLVEEPEAHLHPQLQRVLFGALLKRGCQIIATTHSTHITSHVPMDSIVVLTDDGTPRTSSCAPCADATLTPKEIGDLERYLDATRGALLFARKVLLVEGPAELFLIPAIVKQVLKSAYHLTNSCGKAGRRTHWQNRKARACGACVPCLFRRASLHVIGCDDEMFGHDVLASLLEEHPDFHALIGLVRRKPTEKDIARALIANGRLPLDRIDAYAGVVARMIAEVEQWLSAKAPTSVCALAGIAIQIG